MMFFLIAMIVLAPIALALFGLLAYVAMVDRREVIARQSTEGDYIYRRKQETKTIKAKGIAHA